MFYVHEMCKIYDFNIFHRNAATYLRCGGYNLVRIL